MGRISAGISGLELKLLNRLAQANTAATLSAFRQATGHKINSPADNPSAFVDLSQLQSQLTVVKSTLGNVTAASAIVSQAQLMLDQIRTQVNAIRQKAIADQDAALTADQRTANQSAIDEAIAKINQLAQTSVGGRRLFDGSADFTYSGANPSQIASVEAASLGFSPTGTISGSVTTPATEAQLVHTELTGTITNDATVTLSGNRGSISIDLTNGETLANAAQAVNAQSDLTGITASVSGNDLKLTSIDYGSNATVSTSVTSGSFAVTGGDGNGSANGVDAVATINGRSRTGIGNAFSIADNGFEFSLEFQGGFSGAFHAVTVSGNALAFALTTDVEQLTTLALPSLQPSRLGGVSGKLSDLQTGGSLAGLGTNTPMAVRVADAALAQLTRLEGRVDGFANAAISASSGLLTGMQKNLTDAIDGIDKVDPEIEAQQITLNNALAANALAGLTILNAQRASILSVIQLIANPLGTFRF